MFGGKFKNLQEIWELLFNRKLDEAKDKLEKFEKKGKLSKEEKIRLNLLYSKYYDLILDKKNRQENQQKALDISIQSLEESKKTDNKLLIIDVLLNLAWILLERHLYDDSLEKVIDAEKIISEFKSENNEILQRKAMHLYLKGANNSWLGELDASDKNLFEGLEICKKIDEKFIHNIIYLHLGGNWIARGGFEKSKEYFEKGLDMALELNNKAYIARYNDSLAAIYQWFGKYDTALSYIQKSISLYEEIGIQHTLGKSRLGLHHYYIGELDKAIKILDDIIPKLLESESKRLRCYGYWQKGLINWLNGNLDVAIEAGKKSVKIAEEMNDRYHIDLFNVFLAAFYFDKGNYDQTLNLCLQSIKSSQMQQEKYTIAFANYLLGKVHHIKGEYELAWDYAHKGLQQRKDMDALHHIIDSLFSLIQILFDKNDIIQAESYLDELVTYVDKKPTKRFIQIKKISEAIIKRSSTRPRLWIKAIDILEEVVNEEVVDHSLSVIALINLCELLINEFSFSGDSEVLLELEKYTEMLENEAKEQKSYNLRLEASNVRLLTMWLKAQYSIADIDFHKAKDLLLDARNMADEEGLTRLAEKITKHQVKFLERIDQWDDFIKRYYEFIKE
ncbi:MAG: hypothetical protein FK730_09940 [Asgard group archaeon]|nr:hypothetical protein [Asgard group archaeon]